MTENLSEEQRVGLHIGIAAVVTFLVWLWLDKYLAWFVNSQGTRIAIWVTLALVGVGALERGFAPREVLVRTDLQKTRSVKRKGHRKRG